jgi:hypothetical protein
MLRGLSAFPFFLFDVRDLNDSDLRGQGVQTYTLASGLKLADRAAMILLAPDEIGAIPFHASSHPRSEAGDVCDYLHECAVEPVSRGAFALGAFRVQSAPRALRMAFGHRVAAGSGRAAPTILRNRSDPAAA